MSKTYIPNPNVWMPGDSYPGFPYAELDEDTYSVILECRAQDFGRARAEELMDWLYVMKEVKDASD